MSAVQAVSESGTGRPAGLRVDPRLALAALGVVFGDIGTSPLYTLHTCFTTAHVDLSLENVLGILSLLLWLLAFVVCVKYVGTLMKVDHEGEGGILALLALASPAASVGVPLRITWLTVVVVAGAAMLFGDGIITPAISVLSAVEGVGVATKAAQPLIVPLSAAILIALFSIQWRGTEKVGRLFGPVMALWFIAIGVAGGAAIVRAPQIFYALDPRHAFRFITHHGIFGFLIFGAVVLAMTGVEALYADMSHFGRAPIAFAWYALVFPALILNYLGQGAALLAEGTAAFDQPFYALSPPPFLIPMVVLATLATVIASQALISGAFTLTEQAINLSLWPRLTVLHTSSRQRGQVYVPAVNAVLGVACVALVLTFRTSDNLAAAYGLAVSATMLATSIAFCVVIADVLKWNRAVVVPLITSFVVVDGAFFLSGLPKVPEGAWVPLVISAGLLVTALTWLEGRRSLMKALHALQMPLERFIKATDGSPAATQGMMVFLTADPRGVPFVGKHCWVRERAEEERVVLLTLTRAARPYVSDSERVKLERISERLSLVSADFGYMERPRVAPVVKLCKAQGLDLASDTASFFYPNAKLTRAAERALPNWLRGYFGILARNAHPLYDDLGIAAEQRVELGVEVAI